MKKTKTNAKLGVGEGVGDGVGDGVGLGVGPIKHSTNNNESTNKHSK